MPIASSAPRALARCRALNPSACAARSTRARVAGATEPRPDIAREAVPRPTPASFATSLIVVIESSPVRGAECPVDHRSGARTGQNRAVRTAEDAIRPETVFVLQARARFWVVPLPFPMFVIR